LEYEGAGESYINLMTPLSNQRMYYAVQAIIQG
jgi:hypothetical protein